jgi:ribose 5-phosphate isomerase B
MKIALGADHAGLDLMSSVRDVIVATGHDVVDLTPPVGTKVDYPLYAQRVAQAIVTGSADRGILICGSGVGMSIAANKHNGIRAALTHESYSARMSRAHNDANVLCLGARIIGSAIAEECVRAFLDTEFEGGRHAKRVAMFAQIETTAQIENK